MFDYKLIEALAKVSEEGGFDKAACALHITQSAVSQRLKLLEEQMGQILLVRTSPPRLTPAGQELVKHFLQVNYLEDELQERMGAQFDNPHARLTVAINADSLATWFLVTIQPFIAKQNLLLDIRVEDQDETLHLLKNGDVVGCISTHNRAIQGCNISHIGSMPYHMVAAPEFAAQWFPEGFTLSHTAQAPAIFFNRKDDLHRMFLRENYGIQHQNIPAHYIPSSEKFSHFMVAGLGYGLLPFVQSKPYIDTGKLIDLSPGHTLQIKLYWHCWNLKSKRLEKLSHMLKF